ncbi:hypothetical protein ACNQGB_00615 [Flavobacterium sp. XS1P32]|uniref:hypothetical protein n=1 Tax=Flavobacterium sp. XS1P32 TaxID=3401726 RepID=UPI003AABEB5B
MKQIQNSSTNFKKTLAIASLFLFQGIAQAQDKEVDVNLNLNDGGNDWYAEPWVLVVGAAVFIIIIVALLRGKSSN